MRRRVLCLISAEGVDEAALAEARVETRPRPARLDIAHRLNFLPKCWMSCAPVWPRSIGFASKQL